MRRALSGKLEFGQGNAFEVAAPLTAYGLKPSLH
jgi:hypothetical protein